MGYRDAAYAHSFTDVGEPLRLPRSGGWIVKRDIPGSCRSDAMGIYPLFSCGDWGVLGADVDELRDALVSLVVVTDPFGGFNREDLARAFPERLVTLREHFIVDYRLPDATKRHHRYYAARAARDTEIVVSERPLDHLEEWIVLYETLVRRHSIRGVRAFSRAGLRGQLATPGMLMLRARRDGATIAAHLWLARGEVAYSHLAASSEQGYAHGTSYALYRAALDYFRGRVTFLDLGGAAGDGLRRFKAGWATGTRPAYLGGRIFDHSAYRLLSGGTRSDFFPAYREAER